MRSHGFRKFFINQCIKASLTESTWKSLVGHKLPKTDSSYIRLTEEYLLAQYIKAIPLLTIDPSQRLKQENQDLKTIQAQEIAELKEQMNELKQLVYPLSPSIPKDKQARAIWWKLHKAQRKEKGEDINDWPDEPPRRPGDDE